MTGPRLRVALLTYSTRPRGGVVATLCLAEALARAGHQVDVWTLARGGDGGFFRPVDPAVRVRAVPFPDVAGESVGARVLRSIAVLGAAFRGEPGPVPTLEPAATSTPSATRSSAREPTRSRAAGGGRDRDRGRGGARPDGARHDGAHPDGARHDGAHPDGARHDTTAYDVVHAQDCISANAVPDCVRTVHHLDTFTTPELVACHERALRRPTAHVCVSGAVAAELRAGWGIEATVIPNGVEAGRFGAAAGAAPAATAARAAWRDRLGPYVLAVGGIEPRKGTDDLVEAMALLRGLAPRLVIAGGETLFDYRDYRTRVLDRAARLGVEPVLLGAVPHEELPALVAAADVFAFPSVREGFGLAAMEALAAGVPVVTRDTPVLREVFAGAARFASTPATFAAELAAALAAPDPGLRAAGIALAGRHGWDAAAAAHVRLYRRLL